MCVLVVAYGMYIIYHSEIGLGWGKFFPSYQNPIRPHWLGSRTLWRQDCCMYFQVSNAVWRGQHFLFKPLQFLLPLNTSIGMLNADHHNEARADSWLSHLCEWTRAWLRTQKSRTNRWWMEDVFVVEEMKMALPQLPSTNEMTWEYTQLKHGKLFMYVYYILSNFITTNSNTR